MNRGGDLTIVGTGFIAAGHTTLEALAHMRGASRLFYLVSDPVTVHWLQSLNDSAESLADAYVPGRARERTYHEMAERILAPVRQGHRVCAAFYGHPGVFVDPSHEAIRRARAEGLPARMLPGISAEDCLFADLGLDPGEYGCQSFEATDFLISRRRFDNRSLLVIWQIGAIGVLTYREGMLWSRRGLAVLTEELRRHYAASHEIVLYEAAPFPVCEPRMERIRLNELPGAEVSLATTLVVSPSREARADAEMLARLGMRA
ncbi:MAG: SAM-dependent methyltransferase [Acidobacteriota bacterium]